MSGSVIRRGSARSFFWSLSVAVTSRGWWPVADGEEWGCCSPLILQQASLVRSQLRQRSERRRETRQHFIKLVHVSPSLTSLWQTHVTWANSGVGRGPAKSHGKDDGEGRKVRAIGAILHHTFLSLPAFLPQPIKGGKFSHSLRGLGDHEEGAFALLASLYRLSTPLVAPP